MADGAMGLPRGTIRALLALVVVVTICYMFATSGACPANLLSVGMLILGFYFGQKVQGG